MKKIITQIKSYRWGKLFLELLVVFLGVTAGFILNNWSQSEDQHILRNNYIENISKEVVLDLEELKEYITKDSIFIQQANSKAGLMRKSVFHEDSIDNMIKELAEWSKVEFHKSTYNDIYNSGNLNLLTDFELRSGIVNYYTAVGNAEFIDAHYYNFYNDFIMPFLVDELNFMNGKLYRYEESNLQKLNSLYMINFSLIQQRRNSYLQLFSEGKGLMKLLNKD